MDLHEKHYAVALSIVSSPVMNNIWEYLYSDSPGDIYRKISLEKKLKTQDFISIKYSDDPIEASKTILDITESKSIKVISFWDDGYPMLLKEIDRPPIVLYLKGEIKESKSIAVVGTRKADVKSKMAARRIAADLALLNYTIVSGMAVGIDREAHLGALEIKGTTIGILANGIDIIYPKSNSDLYYKIEANKDSALISEYPPGIFAGKWTFIRRNRIISGLCQGTVVVKAGYKSGALITARYALEQNREVFACTGHSFDEEYSGCHNLIKNGAVLVSNTEDIIRELSEYKNESQLELFNKCNRIGYSNEFSHLFTMHDNNFDENSIEKKILNLLSYGESDIDSIIRDINIPANTINETLIMLELSGRIIRNGNIISKV